MTHNEKEQTAEQAGANRKWYSLRVISGKEKKIKERIDFEVERSNWKLFIFQVIVPTEKVYKIRNGKKVVQERNLLPGTPRGPDARAVTTWCIGGRA